MTPILLLAAAVATMPPSITNARIEVRAGLSPAAALDAVGAGKEGSWVGWSVAAIPDGGNACCFSGGFRRRGCSLSDRDSSWGTTGTEEIQPTPEMYVLVESRGGKPSRVRVFSPDCPVDGADRRVVWLGPVDAGASLAALEPMLRSADGDRIGDPALAAIAFHRDARADALIEKRVLDRSLSAEAREQSVFWAGNARGEAGYRLLDRVLDDEPNADLRQHAAFALSQSHVAAAPARIRQAAAEDRDPEVRAHALFSLSQTREREAGAWIVERLDAERDDHVREQAVFALSQLEDGTDWLLKVLRSKRDPQTVRHALFWLGQSDDPRALDELTRILER